MREADIRPLDLFNRYLELCRADVERFFADRRAFVEVPCHGYGGDHAERDIEKLGFRYLLCFACGSLYASPRRTPAMIGALLSGRRLGAVLVDGFLSRDRRGATRADLQAAGAARRRPVHSCDNSAARCRASCVVNILVRVAA